MTIHSVDTMKATPTQQRILERLSDGRAHSRKELHSLLWDDRSNEMTVAFHISMIRKLLWPLGEDIVSRRVGGVSYYIHMRSLQSV